METAAKICFTVFIIFSAILATCLLYDQSAPAQTPEVKQYPQLAPPAPVAPIIQENITIIEKWVNLPDLELGPISQPIPKQEPKQEPIKPKVEEVVVAVVKPELTQEEKAAIEEKAISDAKKAKAAAAWAAYKAAEPQREKEKAESLARGKAMAEKRNAEQEKRKQELEQRRREQLEKYRAAGGDKDWVLGQSVRVK